MKAQDQRAPFSRLIITLGVLAVLNGLEYIPLPLLDLSRLPPGIGETIALRETGRLLSIVALGVTPLVSGFVTVEVVAWLVPRWRRARLESPELRQRLDRAALILSLVLACFQGFGVGIFLEGLHLQLGDIIATDSVWTFRLVTMATLAAGTGVAWLGARLIDQRGLGGGLSILVAWAALQRAVFLFERTLVDQESEHPAPVQFSAIVAIICISVGLLLMARFRIGAGELAEGSARSRAMSPEDGAARATPYRTQPRNASSGVTLRALPAGLIPTQWAQGFLGLAGSFGLVLPQSHLRLVGLVLLVILAVALGLHFHDPHDVAEVRRRAFPKARELGSRTVSRQLVLPLIASTVGLVMLDWVLPAATPVGYPLVTALLVAPVIAVLLDLHAEWRVRMRVGELAVAWQAHRVYAADTAVDLLNHHGIEALARSIHHRTILQFFGPYVPIAICVPTRHRKKARRLLRKALGDNQRRARHRAGHGGLAGATCPPALPTPSR